MAHKTDLFKDHDITMANAEPKPIPVLIVSFVYDMMASFHNMGSGVNGLLPKYLLTPGSFWHYLEPRMDSGGDAA